ncbi:MAG TPA: hypothetical protein VF008_19930 [Niastella sp.]
MNRIFHSLLIFLSFIGIHSACSQNNRDAAPQKKIPPVSYSLITDFDTSIKTIHVFVALCDNKYQGIVPVPAAIGNGQAPNSNLYWGCSAGIRTYFKNSKEWLFIKRYKVDSIRLERLVFKYRLKKYYLVADAYDGRYIKQCTVDFLRSCAGQVKDTLHINGTPLGIHGNGKLIAYIGHDGLMDFNLTERFQNTDSLKRDAIILACKSKKYFTPLLAPTRSNPLVWTTGLMCPEAYTLHDALTSYIRNEPTEKVRSQAAKAYARYQRCSEKAARNLLVTGW